MPPFDLREKAIAFRDEISDLLNATVCDGIRLTASKRPGGVFLVSYNLTDKDQTPGKAFAVTLAGKPSCYLGLSFRLLPDGQQQYLMVQSSVIALYADQEEVEELLHYDYERDKPHGYPEAHLQVAAESAAWTALCNRGPKKHRPLSRLHLPVGGRRYRPTVEDVVEFLIVEGLADGRPGWEQAVKRGREAFQRRQMLAAVRSDPEPVVALLRQLGHIKSS